jgi:Rrf2 family transcriptional regulator, iron-sulfur cluster assembly transcription factor
MKLSTRSRYGARMLLDIAEHGDGKPVPVSEISKRMGVSVKYLEQLIRPLNKAKYLKSVRGPKGGHLLAKDPEQISMGEIVRLLEGGIHLTECVAQPETCNLSSNCRTRTVWEKATLAMNDILDGITLADLSAPGC